MHADSRLGSEVDAVRAIGNVVIREKYSTAEFDIGHHAMESRPV